MGQTPYTKEGWHNEA